MSEARQPLQETPAALPAAVEPTAPMTTASEATADPIRSQESSTLDPESRPELGSGLTDGATAASPTGPNVTSPHKEEKLGKGETLIESNPINEGILNYKGPGLKGLIFSKKYFWFSDTPLEHKHLGAYIGNEKAKDVAHPNAAHATQTGKGLLFSAKRAEDKDHPQAIFNLADVTDLEKGNFNDFSFKLHGKTHTFQAVTKAEKDGWLVAIETKLSDAKTSREGIVSSSGYRSALEHYGTPAAGAATSTSRSLSRPGKASKSRDRKAKTITTTDPIAGTNTSTTPGTTSQNTPDTIADRTNHTEAGEAAAGTAAVGATGAIAAHRNGSTSDEDKKMKKSRSQSRNKRNSLFGNLLAKKEDHDIKKEVKKEEKEEKKEEKAEDKAIKKDIIAEEKAEKKGEEAELKAEKRELKEERKEEKLGEKEGNPLSTGHTEGMDAHAIAARVVGAPEADAAGVSNSLEEEGVRGTAPVTTAEPTPAMTTKANKRTSMFGSFFGKKEAVSPSATEAPAAVPAKDEPSTVSSTAPQLENPVAESNAVPTLETRETPAAVADTTTPTTTTPTSNRRSSFFSNLGTKKERKTGTTSGDELTDGEGKKQTSGGFGGLLRKASRAQPRSSATNNTTEPLPNAVGTSTDVEKPVTTADTPSAVTGSHEQTPVSAAA